MSDLSDFYEEKRRDKAADREQARRDKAAEREQARQDAKAAVEAAKAERREIEQRKKREQAERTAKRAERIAAAKAWFAAESDTAFSIMLILLAVIPAIASQVGALAGKTDPGSATALALMLELGAWSATVGASRAMRDDRPVTPYRVAMWGCAAIAAAINIAHNGGPYDWFALVMGAASLAGVAFWELRCVGRHGQSRRTKEARAEDRQRKRHTENRRKHHPQVWALTDRILSAVPYGALTQEQAWSNAWEIHHGTTEPGLTPAMVAVRADSRKRMKAALAGDTVDPDPLFPDTVPDDLIRSVPDVIGTVYRSPINDGRDGDDGPAGAPVRGVPAKPSGGPTDRAATLGGKGKRAARRLGRTEPGRPLNEGDLAKVRLLAEALGGKDKLSARNVRETVGCRNDYAIRLRDAVRAGR